MDNLLADDQRYGALQKKECLLLVFVSMGRWPATGRHQTIDHKIGATRLFARHQHRVAIARSPVHKTGAGWGVDKFIILGHFDFLHGDVRLDWATDLGSDCNHRMKRIRFASAKT